MVTQIQNPQTTKSQTAAEQAAEAARALREKGKPLNEIGESVNETIDTGKTGAGVMKDVVAKPGEAIDKGKEKAKGFLDGLDIGSVIGGLLGVGGAWFLGKFMGGGTLGTVLSFCLAIPLMIMGSTKIGGWINEKTGRPKSPQQLAAEGHSRERSVEPTVAPEAAPKQETAPAKETATETPPPPAPKPPVRGEGPKRYADAETGALPVALTHQEILANLPSTTNVTYTPGKMEPSSALPPRAAGLVVDSSLRRA